MEGSGDRQELDYCLKRSTTGQVLLQRAVRGCNLSLKLTAAGFKITGTTGKNDGTRAVDNGQGNGRTLNGLGNHRGRKSANGEHRGCFAQVCRAQTDADGLRSGADEHCEGQDVGEALVIAGDPRAGNLGAQDALGMTEQQGRSRVDIQLGCIKICQSSQLSQGDTRYGDGGGTVQRKVLGVAVQKRVQALQGTGSAGQKLAGNGSKKLTHRLVVLAQQCGVRGEGQGRRESRAPRGPLSRKSQCIGSGDFGKKCGHD